MSSRGSSFRRVTPWVFSLSDSCQGGGKDTGISGTQAHLPRSLPPAAGFLLLPHLVLRRASGKENLTGIEELCVGISEGQHTALGQLGGQLSAFHVQSFLLWGPDGRETSEATGVSSWRGKPPHLPHQTPAKREEERRGEERLRDRGKSGLGRGGGHQQNLALNPFPVLAH